MSSCKYLSRMVRLSRSQVVNSYWARTQCGRNFVNRKPTLFLFASLTRCLSSSNAFFVRPDEQADTFLGHFFPQRCFQKLILSTQEPTSTKLLFLLNFFFKKVSDFKEEKANTFSGHSVPHTLPLLFAGRYLLHLYVDLYCLSMRCRPKLSLFSPKICLQSFLSASMKIIFVSFHVRT